MSDPTRLSRRSFSDPTIPGPIGGAVGWDRDAQNKTMARHLDEHQRAVRQLYGDFEMDRSDVRKP